MLERLNIGFILKRMLPFGGIYYPLVGILLFGAVISKRLLSQFEVNEYIRHNNIVLNNFKASCLSGCRCNSTTIVCEGLNESNLFSI